MGLRNLFLIKKTHYLKRIFSHVYPRPPQLASVDLVYFKLSRLAQTQVLATTGLNRGMADWSPAVREISKCHEYHQHQPRTPHVLALGETKVLSTGSSLWIYSSLPWLWLQLSASSWCLSSFLSVCCYHFFTITIKLSMTHFSSSIFSLFVSASIFKCPAAAGCPCISCVIAEERIAAQEYQLEISSSNIIVLSREV